MDLFIFWIVLSAVAGIIANSRGQSWAKYFFIALLLSPIIGIVAAIVAKPPAPQP